MSFWSMRQLAGHTKFALVCVKAKSLNDWRPTPTSPRRYQPLNSSTGACTRGSIGGGGTGPRSAANAPGIMVKAAAPARTKLFRLPMASSFLLLQGTPGRRPLTERDGADDRAKYLSAT